MATKRRPKPLVTKGGVTRDGKRLYSCGGKISKGGRKVKK